VSAAGTISRLEALLARVRSRAAEPRPSAAVAPAHAAPPRAVAAHAPEPIDEDDDQPTVPPPPGVGPPEIPRVTAPRPPSEPAAAIDVPVEVDLSPEPPEAAGGPAEPVVAAAEAASQERLVMAEPEPMEPTASPAPVGEVAQQPAPVTEVEPEPAEEEPPASSRRPLAPQPEERLAEMAFGATEPRPALHTPPPESGRLPAAPAADVDFPDEDTGVHAAHPPTPITPEATRADLSGPANVAKTHGTVQAFHPKTFAELLEASLKL
jgi:hypothetical protein